MSFSRAAIIRFNEPAASTIPPPGTYDPKFTTDIAVSSSAKTLEKSGRGTGEKARPEGNELRLTRDLSWASKKRSMTSTNSKEIAESGRKEHKTSQNKTSLSKSRVTRPISVTTSRLPRAPSSTSVGPSVTPVAPLKALQSMTKDDVSEETKEQGESSMAASDPCCQPMPEVTEVFKYKGGIRIPCAGYIQEIQDMAENIQVEVSEYKRRLTEEIIRTTEQKEKIIMLEFTIQSLNRELAKYESAKESWEVLENTYQRKLEDFTSTNLKLENELRDLQAEHQELKETELALKEKLAKMENDKSLSEGGEGENEKALQPTLKEEEESGKKSSEKKHEEELSQMPTDCKDIPAKDSETDTQLKMYEAKVQELIQQKEVLNKELDALRQEKKAVLENTDSQVSGSGMDRNQNYIN